jgi:hypothetical protein
MFNACTERYDIKLDEGFTRLVVDGTITNESMHHVILLSTSTSYFDNQLPPAVSDASIYLSDENQTFLFIESEETKGKYVSQDAFAAKPGTAYNLEINLNSAVGEKENYTAETIMPNTAFKQDSIVLEYQQVFDFYLLKLYAFDPPGPDYYKFDAMVNQKMITDTASRSLIVDDRFFDGNNTNGLGVMFIRSDEIQPGDTLTLITAAVSKDYYDFFVQLRLESGQSNPLFSGPPANVESNIQEGGLGYFDARIVNRSSIIVPDDPKNP